jgi:hypothetical protein
LHARQHKKQTKMSLEPILVQQHPNLGSATRLPSIFARVRFARINLAAFESGFWRQMPRPPTTLTGMTPIRLFTIA